MIGLTRSKDKEVGVAEGPEGTIREDTGGGPLGLEGVITGVPVDVEGTVITGVPVDVVEGTVIGGFVVPVGTVGRTGVVDILA
jgi:hypothetical protein